MSPDEIAVYEEMQEKIRQKYGADSPQLFEADMIIKGIDGVFGRYEALLLLAEVRHHGTIFQPRDGAQEEGFPEPVPPPSPPAKKEQPLDLPPVYSSTACRPNYHPSPDDD